MAVKHVLFYESGEDYAEMSPLLIPRHEERVEDFRAQGTLLMVGAFSKPQEEGTMAIFTTREAAEDFAQGDPLVVYGVVRDWYVRQWNEILSKP